MNFRFQSLLGTPYRGGNAVITEDTTLLSPVGNRVSSTDLLKSQTLTLPFESASKVSRIAASPDGVFLLAVDEAGRASFVNLSRSAVLHRITFKGGPVTAVEFSPNGALIAVGIGKLVQIWRSPGFKKEFFSFQLKRTFADCAAEVTSLDWSPASEYNGGIQSSKDLTVRLFGLNKSKEGNIPFLFSGHREPIVGAFFSADKKSGKVVRVYTISRDGAIFTWNLDKSFDLDEPPSPGTPEQEPFVDGSENFGRKRKNLDKESEIPLNKGKWELVKKDFFMQSPARLTACDYHNDLDMVVVAFSNGVFGLYQMPDFVCIHLLSISREKITTAVFNRLGNWLTFGCTKLGQLLVWEWKSESYVLKQQGHYFDVNCVSYSPDSQMLATGADDNKVKSTLWVITIVF